MTAAIFIRNRRLRTWEFVLSQRPAGEYRLSLGLTGNWFFLNHLWLPSECRTRHIYVVGASGSGKTSLLLNLLCQDITAGMGTILIDPHGDLVKELLPLLASIERPARIMDLENTDLMLTYN